MSLDFSIHPAASQDQFLHLFSSSPGQDGPLGHWDHFPNGRRPQRVWVDNMPPRTVNGWIPQYTAGAYQAVGYENALFGHDVLPVAGEAAGSSTPSVSTPSAASSSQSPPSYTPDPACVICMDVISPSTAISLPCGHTYDPSCLSEHAMAALRDESLFPPRCCGRAIPPFLLPPDVLPAWEEKQQECRTLKRVYCAEKRCSRFLGSMQDESSGEERKFLECKECNTKTCNSCRSNVEESDDQEHQCKEDDELKDLKASEGWVSCPGCNRLVERLEGCTHMACRCGTQFCYQCSFRVGDCICRAKRGIYTAVGIVDEMSRIDRGGVIHRFVRLPPGSQHPMLQRRESLAHIRRVHPYQRRASNPLPMRYVPPPPPRPPVMMSMTGPASNVHYMQFPGVYNPLSASSRLQQNMGAPQGFVPHPSLPWAASFPISAPNHVAPQEDDAIPYDITPYRKRQAQRQQQQQQHAAYPRAAPSHEFLPSSLQPQYYPPAAPSHQQPENAPIYYDYSQPVSPTQHFPTMSQQYNPADLPVHFVPAPVPQQYTQPDPSWIFSGEGLHIMPPSPPPGGVLR